MTGALNVMVGNGWNNINLCTVLDVGGGVRRAGTPGGGGPILPNIPFKGAVILTAECIGDSLAFRILISGNWAQNFFSRLVVQDSAGVFRTLTSASATGFTQGTNTQWGWSVAGGTSLVWPTPATNRWLQLYP